MKKFLTSTAFILVMAILIGSLLGFCIKLMPENAIAVAREVLMAVKTATGQIIFYGAVVDFWLRYTFNNAAEQQCVKIIGVSYFRGLPLIYLRGILFYVCKSSYCSSY